MLISRRVAAALRIIPDGDIAGVIFTTRPDETGIDLYLGIGGAPEGVLAAGALRCVGGQMQGRLILDTQEKIDRAVIRTETLIYRSVTGTVRKISAEHREMGKFKLT